ncbi:MAG: OmpA family protein [Bacteroidales bacterium]|nr:OmpA family protein [Bacteroidales bacterium]
MSKSNVWISVSDLMTGLMIIFLFVAISYMVQVKNNQKVLEGYIETKENLHDKLVDEFKNDTTKWQMSIGKDLTIKFDNPTVLFDSGEWELTSSFKNILQDFLPRYFNILLKDSLRTKIQEIRIEGHTDDVPIPKLHNDPYIANIILSQQRALSVVKYFRELPVFKQYTKEEQNLIEYWLIASGFSYGKSLDDNGEYTFKTKNNINKDLSRRVEIRIVTNGDIEIEKFMKN